MMERIQKLLQASGAAHTMRTIISPKLQWFFVPAPAAAADKGDTAAAAAAAQRGKDGARKNSKSTSASTTSHNIPNCIHLEGYCSSMEEHYGNDDDDDDDLGFDDDESETKSGNDNRQQPDCNPTWKTEIVHHHGNDEDEHILQARFPWLRPGGTSAIASAIASAVASSTIDAPLPSTKPTTCSLAEIDATAATTAVSSAISSSPPSTPSRRRSIAEEGCSSVDGAQQQQQERRRRRLVQIWKREMRRLHELCISGGSNGGINSDAAGTAGSSSNNNNNTLSGFLLKRSKRDPHVWRRVHCVLDNDYLWFVSRLYHFPIVKNNKNNENSNDTILLRFAKHGRVRLTRALLLEPAAVYPPLFQTPHAFEVMAADGTSHVFRATTKALQVVWMESISDRILQSFENSQLDNAQLVISDECLARNARCEAAAVQPLVNKAIATRDVSLNSKRSNENTANSRNGGDNNSSMPSVWLLDSISSPLLGRHVGNALRWGMEVADYREYCRHVHSILPPKSPVVVVSSSSSLSMMNTNRGRTSSTSMLSPSSPPLQSPKLRQSRSWSSVKQVIVPSTTTPSLSASNGRAAATVPRGKHQQQQQQLEQYQEPLNPFVVDMIQSLWQQASHLLLRAMQVGEDMYPQSPSMSSSSPLNSNGNNGNHHSSHHHHHTSMETLFRHIDYVITGQRRRCPSKEDDAVKAAVSAAATTAASNGRGGRGNPSVPSSSPRHHHHHEDPPPIDLFDTLVAELHSLAVDTDQQAASLASNVVENGATAKTDGAASS
jgi:hypothetical protein